MAGRSHGIHEIQQLPLAAGQIVRDVLELVVTTVGIAWLDPRSAYLAVGAAVVAVALPLSAQPIIAERDLRARSHLGALARFYLDAMLGLVPIRTHGAERALHTEHESLLVEWTHAARRLVAASIATEAAQSVITNGLTVALVLAYLAHASDRPGGVLLVVFWALNIPALGQEIALLIRQYPAHRNRTLRLLEPLGAPEAAEAELEPGAPRSEHATSARGAAIEFAGVSIVAAGHTILRDVDLSFAPGEHVAIVGPSGAGKSSFVGALLGWHRPSAGRIVVDRTPLAGAALERLRAETAWVDPAVQVWNRALLDNLRYGSPQSTSETYATILDFADLHSVLAALPDGLQTALGEGGALVSGGEGQRVRFGRALLRRDARLVILDEPFRGLDRDKRRLLLERARTWWKGATVLCITHDVTETLAFGRVLVIDQGRVAEDGPPTALRDTKGSLYARLLQAEQRVHDRLWSGELFRHVKLEHGRLFEKPALVERQGSPTDRERAEVGQ
jgi:ATP-binding cassette subfamily B protein